MMFQKSATPPDVCAPDVRVYHTSLHVTNFPPNYSTTGDKLRVNGLVPRIFFFFFFSPSVCVHNNSHGERKTSEKQGRPGSMHHMNDVRWMWLMSGGCDLCQVDVTRVRWMWLMSGGCDSCQVDVRWTWEEGQLAKQCTGPSIRALYSSIGVQTLAWSKLLVLTGKKLAFKFSTYIFQYQPLPPMSTSCPFMWWMLPGLPHFSLVFRSPCIIVNANGR